MKALLEAKTVVPVIDKRFPLNEIPEVMRYFGEGNVKGKIVINTEQR